MGNELITIKRRIQQAIQHPILDQYIQKIEIDEDRLFVLEKMFAESSFSFDPSEEYITSIILCQMASELHDAITLDALNDSRDIKARQLMILAGDYYSTQIHCVLADLKDFKMLGHLSDAVVELNARKVDVFSADFHWQQIFDFFYDIESIILSKIATVLGMRHWMPMIARYFTLKRVLHETERCYQGSPSQVLQAIFEKRPEKKKQFVQAAESFIGKLVGKIEKDLQEGLPFLSQLSLMKSHWDEQTMRFSMR